jgi:CBS-domain-containing membrane protein
MLQRKRTLRVLVAVLGAAAVAVFAVGASASNDAHWFVGMNLHFTGPDTTAGTFVMSGAVEDSGAATWRTCRSYRSATRTGQAVR